ncbi:hypothetical protein DJ568_00925 [Mucilaginibacter hurinus]|uniref:Uncharacterized protein n=2 Tax=Mucilaginibacter hurinus TaxID=2201324 RepID=A0A367GSQ1_9SPHI|nr:hypothetical protein DJ568_00925 [Mucilaginibacter hurinus]
MTGITTVRGMDDPGKKGFWTVEADSQTPSVYLFKFYYDEKHLLYTETVDFEIDVDQPVVREKLNRMLDDLVKEHEQAANTIVEVKYLARL